MAEQRVLAARSRMDAAGEAESLVELYEALVRGGRMKEAEQAARQALAAHLRGRDPFAGRRGDLESGI